MKRLIGSCLLGVLVLATAGCDSRTDEANGGIILSITDADGIPQIVSVNAAAAEGGVFFENLVISSFAANPNGSTSDLQGVEMDSYQVSFTRLDTGTRTPPVLVRAESGFVPPQGTLSINNLLMMGSPQLFNPPLADLLLANGGFDTETGKNTIILNLHLRFFGETISGEDVATNTATYTIEFVP